MGQLIGSISIIMENFFSMKKSPNFTAGGDEDKVFRFSFSGNVRELNHALIYIILYM